MPDSHHIHEFKAKENNNDSMYIYSIANLTTLLVFHVKVYMCSVMTGHLAS